MGKHSKRKPVRCSAVPRFVVGATVLATTAALAEPLIARADDGNDVDWAAVARCESGGNPAATDPSGQHIGMYQFTRSTWAANGGKGDPRNASPAEQTRVAENVRKSQGMGAWPVCGRHAYDGGSTRTQYLPVVSKPAPVAKHAAPTPVEVPKPTPKPDVLMGPELYPGGDVRAVQAGDCLSSVAGDRWQQVAALNHISGPDYTIYPGQLLVME